MVVSDEIHRLKIEELRQELSNRGLDSSGTKSEMLDRLYAALDKEKSQSSPNVKTTFDNDSPSQCSTKDESSEQQEECSATISQKMVPYNTSSSAHLRSNINDLDPEPLDWEIRQDVFLDYYNCDLNLIIDETGLSARPFTMEGFSLMWAGGKANFGINRDRVFYEVYNICNLDVETNEDEVGGCDHAIRVGWSSGSSSFALGEDKFSYGYGCTGKKSLANQFEDYGCKFGQNDVITCYLDYGQFDAIISYAVNGVDQGQAYVINNPDGRPLFPHVYVKNVSFSVNFDGELQEKICKDNPDDWLMIGKIPIEGRIRGMSPPETKKDCEVIMMIGLPSCGKTTFAEKLCQEKPSKMYNLLGTNYILDKMKIIGLKRKRNYHGRWEVLIGKATKCLNTIIVAAASRRRNYILDQTNVYPTAQRRKMKPFEGFEKRAIVIVPEDEEYLERIKKVRVDDGKDVPDSAINEMKKNFVIPKTLLEDSNSPFVEVEFPELPYEKAQELVSRYAQEAKQALAESEYYEKRSRQDFNDPNYNDQSNGFNNNFNRRGNYRGRPGPFRGGNQRFQRPFMPRPMMRPYGVDGGCPPRGPFMPYMQRMPGGGPMPGWHRSPFRPRMPPQYNMPHQNNPEELSETNEENTQSPKASPNTPDPLRPQRIMRPDGNYMPRGVGRAPFGAPRCSNLNPRSPYPPRGQQRGNNPNTFNPMNSSEADPSSMNQNGSLHPFPNGNQQQQQNQLNPYHNQQGYSQQSQGVDNSSLAQNPNQTQPGISNTSNLPSYAGGFSNPIPGFGMPAAPVTNSHTNSFRNYNNNPHEKLTQSRYPNVHLNSNYTSHPNPALIPSSIGMASGNGGYSSAIIDPSTATSLLAPSAASTDPSALAVAAYANYYASVGVSGAAAGKAAAGTSSSETSLQAAIAAAASFNQKQVIKSNTLAPQTTPLPPSVPAMPTYPYGQMAPIPAPVPAMYPGSYVGAPSYSAVPVAGVVPAIPVVPSQTPSVAVTTSGQPVNYLTRQ